MPLATTVAMGAADLNSAGAVPSPFNSYSTTNNFSVMPKTTHPTQSGENSTAIAIAESAVTFIPASGGKKRKNHRGGSKKKKSKGVSTVTAEISGDSASEKEDCGLEHSGMHVELKDEVYAVADFAMNIDEGKCDIASGIVATGASASIAAREVGAAIGENGELRDEVLAAGNLDQDIDTTTESVDSTCSRFNDMVKMHCFEELMKQFESGIFINPGENVSAAEDEHVDLTMTAENKMGYDKADEEILILSLAEKANSAAEAALNADEASFLCDLNTIKRNEYGAAAEQDACIETKTTALDAEIADSRIVTAIGHDLSVIEAADVHSSGDGSDAELKVQQTVMAASGKVMPEIVTLAARKAITLPFEIRPSPSKGLGMFATKKIHRGTRIIEEEALMIVQEMTCSAIMPVFAALSAEKKAIFMSLAGAEDRLEAANLASFLEIVAKDLAPAQRTDMKYKEQAAVQMIFCANSFNVAADTSAIFLTASRMNHSCLPNVYHTWNQNINRLTVHALRDIAPGEEILTTYISAILECEQRNDEDHLAHYGVVCDCPACNPTNAFFEESISRRATIVAIDEILSPYFACEDLGTAFTRSNGCFPNVQEALNLAPTMVNLLVDEGITNMDLVKCLHQTGELALLCGRFKQARQCYRTAIRLTTICAGADSPHLEVLHRQLKEAKWSSQR